MPDGLPCPNPVCTHLFPPSSVKGVASLRCPKCGNVFQFQKQAAPAPAKPAAPPPPPKKAPPRPPAPPVAAPVAPPVDVPASSAFSFDSGPDLGLDDDEPGRIRKRRTPRRGRWLSYAVVFVLFNLMIGGATYFVLFVMPHFMNDDARKHRVQANFSFTAPASWPADDKLRRQIGANVALSRTNPRAHLALFYTDYKTRLPGDDELVEEAVKRLKPYFPRLEYVDPVQSGRGRDADLGDEAALRLIFKATAADQVPMVGECLMTARRGIGYWWMTWGPEEEGREALQELWDTLREGFRLHNEREGWRPSPRPTTPARLEGTSVEVSYVTEVWRPETDNVKDYDPLAVLVLRAFEKEGNRPDEYAGKAATIQALLLPKAADLASAVTVAKEQVEKQQKLKLEPYLDRGGKQALGVRDVGALKGEVRQFDVKEGTDVIRFAALAVVNRPEGVLAFYFECPPGKRGYWLGELKAFLATVRLRK